MQTRREQVRAYNYQVKRLVRGVLMGKPEHWDQPFRRSTIGTVVGMILALIAVVGCVLFGLLRPGAGPELASDTTVVVEKDTGTRYLVADGTLRPVANLASALLLAGPQLHVQSLPQGRTRSLPRGTAVGIVGAPEDVPGADGVSKAGWSVCLRATTATTGLAPSTVIAFTGTQQLTRVRPFAKNDHTLCGRQHWHCERPARDHTGLATAQQQELHADPSDTGSRAGPRRARYQCDAPFHMGLWTHAGKKGNQQQQ
jgi:type VII secretion protein EccB